MQTSELDTMSYCQLKSSSEIKFIGFQSNIDEATFYSSKYVFKYEYAPSKMMTVIFKDDCTEEKILNYMIQYSRNWYDLIRDNKPVREFYDIDLAREDIPSTLTNDDDIVHYIVNTIINMRNTISEGFGTTSTKECIVMTANNETKISIHLIVKNVFYSCVQIQKDFQKHVHAQLRNSEQFFTTDLSVYSKNRCFRLLNNTKYDQDRPLRLFHPEVYNYSSTLQSSVVYPLASLTADEVTKTKFDWVPSTKSQDPQQLVLDMDSVCRRQGLAVFFEQHPYLQLHPSGRINRIDHTRRACLCDPEDFHSTENMYLYETATALFARCFCNKGKPVLIEYIRRKVDLPKEISKYTTHKFHTISSEDYTDIIKRNHIVIDTRSTGSGKTYNAIHFAKDHVGNQRGKFSFIGNRQSLDESINREYGDHVVSYKSDHLVSEFKQKAGVSICLNSTYKILAKLGITIDDLDLTTIDEVQSVIRQFEMKNLQLDINTILNLFENSIKPLILLDANITDECIEKIINMRKRSNPNAKICVISDDIEAESFKTMQKPKVVVYSADHRATKPMLGFIVQQLYAHDFSANKVILPYNIDPERMNTYLEAVQHQFPHLKTYNISAKNRNETDFSIEFLSQFDILAYSPTISEGVSFNEDVYADYIGFGCFTNLSSSVFSINQSMKRMRKTMFYKVFIEEMVDNKRPYNTKEEYIEFVEKNLHTLKNITLKRVKVNGYHQFVIEKDDFWDFHLMTQTERLETSRVGEFKRKFIQLCINNNFEVYTDYLEPESDEDIDKYIEIEQIKEDRKTERIEKIKQAKLIDRQTFEQLKNINTEESDILQTKYKIHLDATPCLPFNATLFTADFYREWYDQNKRKKMTRLRDLIDFSHDEKGDVIQVQDTGIQRHTENVYAKYDEWSFYGQRGAVFTDLYKINTVIKFNLALGFRYLPSFNQVMDKTEFQQRLYKLGFKQYQSLCRHFKLKLKLHEFRNLPMKKLIKELNKVYDFVGIRLVYDGKTIQHECSLEVDLLPTIPDRAYIMNRMYVDGGITNEAKSFFSGSSYCYACDCDITTSRGAHNNSRTHKINSGSIKEGDLVCGVCKKTFGSEKCYNKHIEKCELHKCKKCDYTTTVKCNIERHQKKHE